MVESKKTDVLKTFQFKAVQDISAGNVLCFCCQHRLVCNPGKDLKNACRVYGIVAKEIKDSYKKE